MAIQPWAIDGAKLSAAQARAQAFKESGGARGVTLPNDLKVTALPTPGAAVRVSPGGATMPNDYPGGTGQSYGTLMVTSEDVAVPATGSSGGATRYLIQRITDPEFSGQPPADPLDYRYDPFVLVSSISNLAYPWVPLARISQPANTATITQAMITDLRKVANPRREPVQRYRSMIADDTETLTATSVKGEGFPNVGRQIIDVPSWATRANIRADWGGVKMPVNSGWGTLWVGYGPYADGAYAYQTQNNQWNASDNAEFKRESMFVGGDVGIPAALRGTSVQFAPMMRQVAGTNKLSMDGSSSIMLEVTFLEVADPSTT